MEIFDMREFDAHEHVVFGHDASTGLRAIIAIHSTALGSAAGAANNQLAQDQDGTALQAAGVLYAPDYVINAGGIISVSREYHGGASEAQVIADIQAIPVRLTEIFERARRENRTTNAVADQMARERLARRPRSLVA